MSNKSLPTKWSRFFSSRDNIGSWVSTVLRCGDVSSQGSSHCYQFTHSVVTDQVRLLPQIRLWALCIMDNWHIIIIDICWTTYSHTHHPKLVVYSTHSFHPLLHCHKLCSKQRGFYRCLHLGKPVHKRRIYINKVACLGPSRSLIRGVVRVSKHMDTHLSYQRLGTVARYRFFNVYVQPFPFMLLEVCLVNRRVCRVKDHTRIVSCFQVGKEMEPRVHMAFPLNRHLRRQRRHFCYNVHATYFNHPV